MRRSVGIPAILPRALGDGAGWLARGVVGRLDDASLERLAGRAPVLATVAGAMARRYRADVLPGFGGTVVYTLTRPATRGAPSVFTLHVHDGRASAGAGAPADGAPVAARVELPLGDFVRIAAGSVDPVEPLLRGRAKVTGKLGLAARLPEMFGAPSLR